MSALDMVFFKSFPTGNKYTMDLESNLKIYSGEFLRTYCTSYTFYNL